MGGAIEQLFGGGNQPRDDSAERLRRERDQARSEQTRLANEAADADRFKRKKRYGYGQLLGDEGGSYAGYTSSQDKAGKKVKTYALGGGGSV
jgi:hypothetical protein